MKRLRQTGSQVIEFALVLPFMILILFLVIEVGILVLDKALITHASREAVRRAAVLTAATWDPAAIEQGACDALRNILITFSSARPNSTCTGEAGPVITVSPNEAPEFGASVSVTVAFPVTGIFWAAASSFFPGTATGNTVILLTSSTSMTHE